jgi:hypothetical protein
VVEEDVVALVADHAHGQAAVLELFLCLKRELEIELEFRDAAGGNDARLAVEVPDVDRDEQRRGKPRNARSQACAFRGTR